MLPSFAIGGLTLCVALTTAAPKGLVAHYPCDEGKGQVLHDASGNGRHGMIHGVSWVRSGSRSVLRFDGANDSVTFANVSPFDLTRAVSVEVWVKPEAAPGGGEAGIVGKSYDSYVLTYYTDGRCWWYISGGGNSCKGAVGCGAWHHVVGTFDGAVSRLYADGKLADTIRPTTPTIGRGKPFMLGTSKGDPQFTAGAHFEGELGGVAIYDRALSADEVAARARSTHPTREITVQPYAYPLAGHLTAGVDYRALGALPADARLAVSFHQPDRGAPIRTRRAEVLPVDGAIEITLKLGHVDPGPYECRAAVTTSDGKPIGTPAVCPITWPPRPTWPGAPDMKLLNNLVVELLNVQSRPLAGAVKLEFTNPRDGWVFVASTVSPSGSSTVKVTLDGKDVLTHRASGTLEAMRFLTKGPHSLALSADQAATLDRLAVRAIPELIFAQFGAHPHVHEYGKYDWAFLDKHVLDNLNVMIGSGGGEQQPFVERFRRRGKRWMVGCGVPGLRKGDSVDADAAEKYWTQNPGMTDPTLDGVIADEFFGRNTPKYAAWTEAVRRIRASDRFAGKRFYPYCTSMYGAKASREFIQAVIDAGYAFAFERYLPEPVNQAEPEAVLDKYLRRPIGAWRKRMPGAERHMIVCVGTFSQPPESLDINPATNYKVYLDMQLNLLANDPVCLGLYGVMTYLSSYTDEETVRWAGKLFRHYCIEGRTDRLCKDPFVLGHLRNPDFANGLDGWRVAAADEGSVASRTVPGFSWLQGRYPKTGKGNTVLWMKRSARRPNSVSQTLEGLQPGRLYALRMFSGDFGNLAAKQTLGISIRIADVDVLADKSFQHVFANCYSHHHGPFNREHNAWMNYHWLVFRAKAPESELAISDWSDERTPGGPIGQELMMNFVEVQPYDAP